MHSSTKKTVALKKEKGLLNYNKKPVRRKYLTGISRKINLLFD
jgi:hypothetical protein